MKVYFRSSAGTSKKVHRIIKSKAAEGRIECLQQLTLKDVPLIISESKGMGLIRVLEGYCITYSLGTRRVPNFNVLIIFTDQQNYYLMNLR